MTARGRSVLGETKKEKGGKPAAVGMGLQRRFKKRIFRKSYPVLYKAPQRCLRTVKVPRIKQQ